MNKRSRKLYPNNPLGIIALFVFLIEAVCGSALVIVKDIPTVLELLVWFIVLFPSGVAIMFFITLWIRPTSFYGPDQYDNKQDFLTAISGQIREIRQDQVIYQATENPPRNLEDVFGLVDELLKNREYKNIVRIGRGYLKIQEYRKCLRFFEYVLENDATPENSFHYTFLANCAYSHIGLSEWEQAVSRLLQVRKAMDGRSEIWHDCALAYAYKLSGNSTAYALEIRRVVQHPKFRHEVESFRKLYPEIGWDELGLMDGK